MMKTTILLLAVIAVSLASCKKPITEPNSGIYRGTFFQIFENGDTNAQGIANLALTGDEFGGTFNMSGDTTTGSPISCYGNYEINSSKNITFTNTAIIQDLGWQPHYILDTLYQYTFDDHDFTLEMTVDTTRYVYTLVRN